MLQSEVTPDMLRSLLRYDPDAGKLYWRPRPMSLFPGTAAGGSWNAKWAGKEAFTSLDRHGYLRGSVFKRNYRAHRVAWAVAHGRWPAADVDHINGVRADNRLLNLREATRAENLRNSGSRAGSSSQYVGVWWCKKYGTWRVGITVGRVSKHIGYFASEVDAARAYDDAARREHGEFARLNFQEG